LYFQIFMTFQGHAYQISSFAIDLEKLVSELKPNLSRPTRLPDHAGHRDYEHRNDHRSRACAHVGLRLRLSAIARIFSCFIT
jgi:hypothetical protein